MVLQLLLLLLLSPTSPSVHSCLSRITWSLLPAGRVWRRSVQMSKSNKEAFWDGECALPVEQQQMLLFQQDEAQASVDDVAELMQDISPDGHPHA